MQDSESVFPDSFYKYDSQNYRRFLQSYAEDLRTSYNRSFRDIVAKINFKSNIIFTGSSWSLNAVKIFDDYIQGSVRFMYGENYNESVSLSDKDVVIAVSYSGDSEEAITWLKQARRAGSKIIIISAGGRLTEDSFDANIIDLTKGLPSRCSTFTIIGTLLRLFEDAGLILSQASEVQAAVDFLRNQNVSVLAEELSLKLNGIIPLIYSTSSLKNSVDKFKRLINSNAKTTAFFNVLPGADYYEGEGFITKNALFHAVIFSGSDDLSRLKKKTLVFKDSLQSQGVSVTEINIKSKGLVKIVSALIIGEYTSYYLALRYKQDPLMDGVTSKIKKDMGLFI